MRNKMKTDVTQNTRINYRSYLRDLLVEKQKKNAKFSLRSFAKLLGIQSSYLSMVLGGKRDLSEEMAHQIADKLSLNTIETKKFVTLLRLEKASSASHKEQVLSELHALAPEAGTTRDLSVDDFRVISEWYHLPLQILAQLEDQAWSEEMAAKALGISSHEVIQALERMTALEMMEWSPGSRPKMTGGRVSVNSPFKNDALRKYHTQMLEKNIEALTEQTPSERFTGSMNLALDEKQLTEAHEVMKEAMSRLRVIANKKAKGKKVFHANLNIFQISKNTKKSGERK
jgi:uncharacterized protein (TIGR02147 family)